MKRFSRKTASIGIVVLTTVVLAAFAATALAAPPDGGNGKGKGKGKPSPSPSPSPTATATENPAPPGTTNEADEAFVEMMIPHHHQALIMSRLAPGVAGDQVQALASRIDVEQTVEIGTMQLWQGSVGFDVTDPEVAYPMMMQNPMMIEMMGMATQAELDELATLAGDDFDRLFLRLMIDHHEGAIDMIIQLQTNGTDPVLSQISLDMLNTQQIQIDMMQLMLGGLGG